MPLAKKQVSTDRVNFKNGLSRWEIRKLLKNNRFRVLQTDGPVEEKTLRRLNDTFFSARPDIEFRVYGFYSTPCDLRFLSLMTNVQYLSADCLHNATGIESIVSIPRLKGLSIGIWNLESFEFLNDVSDQLEALFLGVTKSKKPDLAPLSRFSKLTNIYLEGQRKNIEVLGHLGELEDVTLRSITVPDLDFLKSLEKMWSLDIKLGGTNNLAAIEGMKRLKYLELWQVLGLEDISVVSTLTGLQHLFLQSLKRVSALPDFRGLGKLRRITLETMKGLQDVSSLRDAPALAEFIHIAASNLQPEDYLPLLENEAVRKVRIGFGSDKKNRAFRKLLGQYGKEWAEFERFEFVA